MRKSRGAEERSLSPTETDTGTPQASLLRLRLLGKTREVMANRLTSTEQFRLAYREGRRASNDFFTVHARRNGLSQSRVGIAVPGRLGKSVDRNRIRRRIREVFRSLPDVPTGVDIVVVAKAAARDVRFADLVDGAQGLIRRLASDVNGR